MNQIIAKTRYHQLVFYEFDYIGQHILRDGVWEPHFDEVIKLIGDGSCVVDIGANFGYNSVLMAKKTGPNGKLYAFEPQRLMFQQLNANIVLNDIQNAYTYNFALSNESGKVLTMEPIKYDQSSVNIGALSIGSGGEPVKTTKLDDLELGNINFIKLDAQGYEKFILQGAEKTIKKWMPTIFIEIEEHHLQKFSVSTDEIYELMSSFGYQIYKINNDWPYDHICTVDPRVENLNLPLFKMMKNN